MGFIWIKMDDKRIKDAKLMDREKGKIVRGELLAFVAAHIDAIDIARADFIPWPVIAERLEINGGRGGRRLIEAVKRARAKIEKAGHKPKQNELPDRPHSGISAITRSEQHLNRTYQAGWSHKEGDTTEKSKIIPGLLNIPD
ncbi:MAG: hypothetical protein ACYDBP_14940 [Leptospirales bacterium]